jgi:hypothetical protein
MNKALLGFFAYFTAASCLLLTACENKKPEIKTSTNQMKDASTKTIENMQAAYKGERTATAKYEAFSKKAETEGFHNLPCCIMPFQQPRTSTP